MMKREHGFTIIEVLTALSILVVGILATVAVFDSSRHLQTVAEHSETLSQRAETELERVLALPYSDVALTGTSTSWSTTPTDYTYVNSSGGGGGGGTCGSGAAPAYQPDHGSGGSTATESLVINGCTYTSTSNGQNTTVTPSAGTVAPVTAWSSPLPGGQTTGGNIYDFVTWTADPTCAQSSTPGQYCATTNDYKRVTIVVTQTGVTQPSNPAIVSGYVTPPSQGRNPAGGGTTCTDPITGQSVSCSTNPCPNCTQIPTTPCSSSCGTCGNTSVSWLTDSIPTGSSWDVSGNGSSTLYLEQTSGSTVTATVCVKVLLVPGGILTGTLSQIGTTFTTTVTLASGVPTPVTFNFSSGLGSAGYVASGVTGTDIQVVTGVSASSTVSILSDSSLGYNDQTTLEVYS